MAGSRGDYRKTADRRAQIIDAATQVFSQNGYTASSVAEIAKHVDLSATGVLHHFSGGKVELLREVLENRDLRAIAHIQQRQGRDFLQGLVDISRQDAHDRGLIQLHAVLAAEASNGGHPAHTAMLTRFQNIAITITRAFQETSDSGELRAGVDPRRAALSTVAAIEGLGLLSIYGFDIDVDNYLKDHVSSFLIDPL